MVPAVATKTRFVMLCTKVCKIYSVPHSDVYACVAGWTETASKPILLNKKTKV